VSLGDNGHAARTTFGNLAILAFLLMQAADGALTYVGVATHGLGAEANPLLVGLMVSVGAVPALLSAKALAAALGMFLHLLGVHRVVALLTAVYLGGAIMPWLSVLGTH
jgi:hypothetical protein